MSDGGTVHSKHFSQSDAKAYNFPEEQGHSREAENLFPDERRGSCRDERGSPRWRHFREISGDDVNSWKLGLVLAQFVKLTRRSSTQISHFSFSP